MGSDRSIINHYTQAGLGERILAALEQAGKSLDPLHPDDLAAMDEFHIGGRQATIHLMTYLQFHAEMHILDVGSGLGGAARYVAHHTRARLTGIDLTPEYCNVAALLTARTGLQDHIIYKQGNALSMPFPDRDFDGAYTLHTAMNIADKPALYREIARVLTDGAFFGLYDVLRGSGTVPLHFPLPWAGEASNSFLASPAEMRLALGQAGFEILVEDDLSGFAVLALQKLLAVDPVPGPGLVMGDDYRQKIENLLHAIETQSCAPSIMICRKRKWDDPQ